MKIFLDTSVLLAASGSWTGASRHILDRAPSNGGMLLATPYVVEEVIRNLSKLAPGAAEHWAKIRLRLILMEDVLTLNRPVIFDPAKDRPILFSALAWADILLTLDLNDISSLLGKNFYGLQILEPAAFLHQQRSVGQLR